MPNLISALPDDILLLVLVRLRYVRAAARTGLLSRRWRGLWTCLPDLTFRGIPPATVESALARFAASPAVSLLDICIPVGDLMIHEQRGLSSIIPIPVGHTAAQANSLLGAAALLSPAEVFFDFPGSRNIVLNRMEVGHIKLPCFHLTTSIKLETRLCVMPPTTGEFTALEKLSLKALLLDLGTLLNRCPRLRLLSATFWDMQLATPQSAGEFPKLETLALDGNIVDLGTFLNRCPRLRSISITFRSVALLRLAHTMRRWPHSKLWRHTDGGVSVSLLGIHLGSGHGTDATLLRAAARLSPQALVFTHLIDTLYDQEYRNADLPCFPHAVSIKIDLYKICFTRLLGGNFSKLDSMILKRSTINDLSTLVSLCPRLRVLKVKAAMSECEITIHSTSLQELVLDYHTECHGVDILTPMLKQLTMDFEADKDINVFISAPILENVSLDRSYTGLPIVFGFWHLHQLSLGNHRLVTNNHVLYVWMYALNSSTGELDFAQEIEEVLITDFSVLNLSLEAKGHVYGATLLRLFSVPRVHTGLKLLKVILLRARKSEVAQACTGIVHVILPKFGEAKVSP